MTQYLPNKCLNFRILHWVFGDKSPWELLMDKKFLVESETEKTKWYISYSLNPIGRFGHNELEPVMRFEEKLVSLLGHVEFGNSTLWNSEK